MFDPKIPILGQQPDAPKMSAIVVETPEGKIQFPQVAAAMATPELIEAIAEAVYRRFQRSAEEHTAVDGVEYTSAEESPEQEYQAPSEWA